MKRKMSFRAALGHDAQPHSFPHSDSVVVVANFGG